MRFIWSFYYWKIMVSINWFSVFNTDNKKLFLDLRISILELFAILVLSNVFTTDMLKNVLIITHYYYLSLYQNQRLRLWSDLYINIIWDKCFNMDETYFEFDIVPFFKISRSQIFEEMAEMCGALMSILA